MLSGSAEGNGAAPDRCATSRTAGSSTRASGLLSGEAGVGKTVLLDVAAEVAAANGIPVARTVGVEAASQLTYAGLHRLIEPFLSLRDGLTRPQREALGTALGLDEGPPPDRLAVSTAVLSLLERSGPLLVIVDDLPWLDRMSALVLAFVARRLAGTPAGFLGAFRTGETSFFDGGGLAALEVAPLDPAAAETLVDLRHPGSGGADVNRCSTRRPATRSPCSSCRRWGPGRPADPPGRRR